MDRRRGFGLVRVSNSGGTGAEFQDTCITHNLKVDEHTRGKGLLHVSTELENRNSYGEAMVCVGAIHAPVISYLVLATHG